MVDKPSEILFKTSKAVEHIESNIQSIEAPRIDDPIIYYVLESILKSSSPREKEKKGENSHKACIGTLSCSHSPSIYRHLVCRFFIKTFIIVSISTNIHRPYVCDPLGPYISLLNNSTAQITPY